jgi:hypothetical protein
MTRLHVNCSKFCIHLRNLNVPPLLYSKPPPSKIIIQTKPVDMSMILYCSKFRVYKCNGSWVIFIKQNVNFEFQPPAMFIFLFFESGLIKICSSSEDLKFHSPTLLCINFGSVNVRHFEMVKATGLKIMASRPPSMAWSDDLLIVSKVGMGTDTQTGRWPHKPTFSL